ncbi:MAG: NAD(P)H-quinone oxidoreductase [Corynebacteriales bacterium]|nr:NAD(P)H-quinone oxidoreductase [Mycobacteriales bacterium]
MRAINVTEPGGPEVLRYEQVADPVLRPGEVLIDVVASAVNRADLLQRQGVYPPPEDASPILGLECSGTIAAVGEDVLEWHVGDEVCALLAGGGYAERVAVSASHVLPVPKNVSVAEAAALPEVVCTVWSNVFALARLNPGGTFLVHGGSGGIGTMAIQLAHAYGARVFCTASARKAEKCRVLGADRVIDYATEDFAAILHEAGGADVILDNMGAKYLNRNIDALATEGRLVVIGLQGGARGDIDLPKLMAKRASLVGTTLRSRSELDKGHIIEQVLDHVWPLIELGQVRPVIDKAFALADAADAHRYLEDGAQIGKVLLVR